MARKKRIPTTGVPLKKKKKRVPYIKSTPTYSSAYSEMSYRTWYDSLFGFFTAKQNAKFFLSPARSRSEHRNESIKTRALKFYIPYIHYFLLFGVLVSTP